MILCADAEWNPDDLKVVHCIVVSEWPSGYHNVFTNMVEFKKFVDTHTITNWVFHNGLNGDAPVINGYFGEELIVLDKVLDTFVLSRLFDYKKYSTHSLEEIGKSLGVYKGSYTGGFKTRTQEMLDYCEQDVAVLKAFFTTIKKYIDDPQWADSIKLEHQIATVCNEMNLNGFTSDTNKIHDLLHAVNEDMKELEDSFASAFGSTLVEDRRIKLRYTKDGRLYSNVAKVFSDEPNVTVEGDEVVVWKQKQFNPGSPKDRIDLLWEAGWKPVDKTDGYKKAERLASNR